MRVEARPTAASQKALLELKTLVMEDRVIRSLATRSKDPWADADLAFFYTELQSVLASHRESKGSGFFVRDDRSGEIVVVTNKHVVDTAPKVNIWVDEQLSINDCDVRYVDDKIDLAVISIPTLDNLAAIAVASLAAVETTDNDRVVATGYPAVGRGEQSYRITEGNVSNASFRLSERGEDIFIQHTASIDAGNSGGPLFKVNSTEVTGVNMFVGLTNRNLFAAIPASSVRAVLQKAMERPAKGVAGTEPLLAQACRQLFQQINVDDEPSDSILEMMSEVAGMNTLADDLRTQIAINMFILGDKPKGGPVARSGGGSTPTVLPGVNSALVGLSTHNDDALIARAKRRAFEVIRADLRHTGGAQEEWCKSYVEEDFKNYEQDHRVRISLSVSSTTKRAISWRFEQGHWHIVGFK